MNRTSISRWTNLFGLKKYKIVILPLSIILLGILVFAVLMLTRPTASKLPRKQEALLVEVFETKKSNELTKILATGTIRPAMQIPLQSRVTGQIIEVSDKFVPGGIFKKDEVILKIDPSDFKITIRQRQSELATANANLKLELGNQNIAKAEYKLLAETLNAEDLTLVLREPQIEIVKSQIEAAKAALDKAELDLSRTTIKAPFNGAILDRTVELGAQVSLGTSFGNFVGTDKYWLEAKIPVDSLQWLVFPTDNISGSKVKITNPGSWGDKTKIGNISHIAKNLEQNGRLLTVFISINSPLESSKNNGVHIFLNSYVNLEIEGKEIKDVIVLSRDYLRNGEVAWVMNKDNKLEIRTLTVKFRGKDNVYITSGLVEGDLVIKSSISTPVEGMILRVNNNE